MHRLRDLSEVEHVFQLTTPGLPADFPPLKSLGRQPHNLPPQLTPFIGREALAAEIRDRLDNLASACSRSPDRVAWARLAWPSMRRRLVDAYADGVWFVPLAPVACDAGGRHHRQRPRYSRIHRRSIEATLRAYLHRGACSWSSTTSSTWSTRRRSSPTSWPTVLKSRSWPPAGRRSTSPASLSFPIPPLELPPSRVRYVDDARPRRRFASSSTVPARCRATSS